MKDHIYTTSHKSYYKSKFQCNYLHKCNWWNDSICFMIKSSSSRNINNIVKTAKLRNSISDVWSSKYAVNA